MNWEAHTNRVQSRTATLQNGPTTGPQAARNIQSLQRALTAAQMWLSDNEGSPMTPPVMASVNAGRYQVARARQILAAAQSGGGGGGGGGGSGGGGGGQQTSGGGGGGGSGGQQTSGGGGQQTSGGGALEEGLAPVSSLFDAVGRTLTGRVPEAGGLSELWNPVSVPFIRRPAVQVLLGVGALTFGTIAIVMIADDGQEMSE